MRLTSILLSAAAVASAAIYQRQSHGQFQVSNFYFGGSPHSIIQQYELDVTDGTYSAHCQTSSSIVPGLLPFGLRPCNDTCWSFAWTFVNRTSPGPGYVLDITQEITTGTNRTGCYWFNQSQVQVVVDQFNPNGNYYDLSAPQSFNLTYSNGSCIFN